MLAYLYGNDCFCQLTKVDYYNTIDNKIYAFSKGKNPPFDSIVSFVEKHFFSEEDKIRAYYSWTATNINYDVEHLSNIISLSKMNVKATSGTSQTADTVFAKRKAVCEGFSTLLNKFCKASSIQSYLVGGYSKLPDGEVNTDILHAWNVVRADSNWKLIDVTWSGGFVNSMNQYVSRFSDKYFFSKPEEFIKDHLPLDPMWQLLIRPVSKNQFFDSKDSLSESNLNYKDSIVKYIKLTNTEQKYIDALHSHLYDRENNTFMRDLDVYVNNTASDYLLVASVHYNKFLNFQNQKMGKHPNAAICKKAKQLLEIPKQDLIKAIDFLKPKKAYTAEYEKIFLEMLTNANSNLKSIKSTIDSINTYIKNIGGK